VNRRAVNDLIECALQRWYRSVSEWRTPEVGTPTGCVSCRASDFAIFDSCGHWPHDLIHSLVDCLELVSTQLAVELHQKRHCEAEMPSGVSPCDTCRAAARSTVSACAHRHAHDISDVVTQCAMPRLAAYAELHTDLVVSAAIRGEWAS
jgi:hypothetical protein